MKVKSDEMRRLARVFALGAAVMMGNGPAWAQDESNQDRSRQNDRSAARDASRENSNAFDQRRRTDQRSNEDQTQFNSRSQRRSANDSADQTDREQTYREGRQSDRNRSGDVAWLGVMLQQQRGNRQNEQSGVEVAQVYPAGPAARAGIHPGDVIIAVNDQDVRSPNDLIGLIEEQEPGARAQVTVQRDGEPTTLTTVLGSRHSFLGQNQFGQDQSGGQFGQQYGGQSGNQYGSSNGGQMDHYANVPPFAMQLEHDRRMFEQHERIETEIAKLREEVRQLRDLLQHR